MDLEDLTAYIRRHRADVLPFIGSGLSLDAGAPNAVELATALAERTDQPQPSGPTALADLADGAERTLGIRAVQEHLASIVTGLRLRPTAALTAVGSGPGQVVMTTNYDDAIEISARARGVTPVPLLPTDRRILEPPQDGEVHVVHLHGIPEDPESLVLPGRTTRALAAQPEPFTSFLRATFARWHVLYLGFAFGRGETHLDALVAWLGDRVPDGQGQSLLLPATAARARPEDLAVLTASDVVNVVTYESTGGHAAVEDVALALAPRLSDEPEEPDVGKRLCWVQPVLLRDAGDDDPERLRQRMVSLDYDHGASDDRASPQDVLDAGASLVVAIAGMGKSTLLHWLPKLADSPAALADLKWFRPPRPGAPAEEGVVRLLRRTSNDEPLPVEELDVPGGLILLDGLEEVDADFRDDATRAVSAALERWPSLRWVVSSRPAPHVEQLRPELAVFHIVPSRRWTEKYLETRSVPRRRVERAMLDGYGLGDLLTIPMFAARVADRLLDARDGEILPLELLVEQQYAATAAEAARHGKPRADLGDWLRNLAVAFELRGLSGAPVGDLPAIPGAGSLGTEDVRERLAQVSLLSDTPGVASFPRKPLQEGLCADAILRSSDPVAALRHAATAQVQGVELFRDDMELTVDLVFEDAGEFLRADLRDLDEPRWARTVLSHGTQEDAYEAFDLLFKALALPSLDEGGLRSTRAAALAIASRWPEILEARRDQLEHDLRAGERQDRARALLMLGSLPEDHRTAGWLLPCLEESELEVAPQAAAIARRLRFAEAEPRLRKLATTRDERSRSAARHALAEVLPSDRLAEIGSIVAGYNALQSIGDRLLKRLTLDEGIKLVGRASQLDETLVWIVEQLVRDAPDSAWTASRVEALMRALGGHSGGHSPDPDLLASVFARHADAAISAVRVHPFRDGHWGPGAQLMPLSRMDPALLEGEERAELRDAVAFQVREEKEIEERRRGPEAERAHLATTLDRDGLGVDPRAITGVLRLRDLDERHRTVLLELLDRWWPADGFERPEDDWSPATTHAVLVIGGELKPPLVPSRWKRLTDAHLATQEWRDPDLAGNHVYAWLRATRPPDGDEHLRARVEETHDPRTIIRALALSGRPGPLRDAALHRLVVLEPKDGRWLTAASFVVETDDPDPGRQLLRLPLPDSTRRGLISRFAARGETEAQLEEVRRLEADVRAAPPVELRGGESRGTVGVAFSERRPRWRDVTMTSELRTALMTLAKTAAERHDEELFDFAVATIAGNADLDALAALAGIAEERTTHAWRVQLTLDRLARRIATATVLDRLPDALPAVAVDFARRFGTSPPESPSLSGSN